MNVNQNFMGLKRNKNINKLLITNPVVIGDTKINKDPVKSNRNISPIRNKFKSCITPKNTDRTTSSSKTRTGSSSISADKTQVILAICEGRGQARAVVGIAAIDITRPNLILCQINDTQNYINTLTKINVLNPVEILMVSVQIDNPHANRLFVCIKENYIPNHNCTLTAVPRKAFNSDKGLQYINKLCTHTFSSVVLLIKQKFYALSSAAALLSYLEVENIMFAPNSIKVEYQEAENTTLIDIDTADRLELVSSQKLESRFANLFSILNHCCTNIGKRQLRADILQPPCTSAKVEARLDCVQELLENPTLHMNLRNVLVKLFDVDQLLAFATVIPVTKNDSNTDRHINFLLLLKSKIGFIEPLMEELKTTTHPTFRALYHNLERFPLNDIQKLVSCMIQNEAHPLKGQGGNFQRAFAVKRDINSYLDITRKTYSKLIDDMREYVNELANEHNLPLKVNYNARKAYHIQMHLNAGFKHLKKHDLPNVFVQVERLSNCFSMTTMDLVHYNRRIKSTLDEILRSSNQVIEKVLLDLRAYVGHFYTLCDDIALLDVLQALAQASNSGHAYIRPEFSSEYMELIDSRHPLLDFLPNTNSVSNPVFASDFYNFHLITGPNMSGKSIYIRQIILIQIMAQVGCYVPAKKATLRLSNRIFARIGQNDDLEHNASSFLLEMKEMQYIFNFMSDNSLIIIDEVCRSTSFDEGISIAWAICENLLKSKAYTFFATHFLYLQKLKQDNLNVSIWQLETDEEMEEQKLHYKHIIKPGITTIENYGLKLVKRCAISKVTIKEAEKILKQLLNRKEVTFRETFSPTTEQLQYKLSSDLKLLELKNELTTEIYNQKIKEYEEMTGQTFDPVLPKSTKLNINQNDLESTDIEQEQTKEINKNAETCLFMKNNSIEETTTTMSKKNENGEISINSRSTMINTMNSKENHDMFNSLRSKTKDSEKNETQSTANKMFNTISSNNEVDPNTDSSERKSSSDQTDTTSTSYQNNFINDCQINTLKNSVTPSSDFFQNNLISNQLGSALVPNDKISEKTTTESSSSKQKSVHFKTPIKRIIFGESQPTNDKSDSDFSLFKKSNKSVESNKRISEGESIPETIYEKENKGLFSQNFSEGRSANDFSVFKTQSKSIETNKQSEVESIPETIYKKEKSKGLFYQNYSDGRSANDFSLFKTQTKSAESKKQSEVESIPETIYEKEKSNQNIFQNQLTTQRNNVNSNFSLFQSKSLSNFNSFEFLNQQKGIGSIPENNKIFGSISTSSKNQLFFENLVDNSDKSSGPNGGSKESISETVSSNVNRSKSSNNVQFAKKLKESIDFPKGAINPEKDNSLVLTSPLLLSPVLEELITPNLFNRNYEQKDLSTLDSYLGEYGETNLTPYFHKINLEESVSGTGTSETEISRKGTSEIGTLGRGTSVLGTSGTEKVIQTPKLIKTLPKTNQKVDEHLFATPKVRNINLKYFTPQIERQNNNLNTVSALRNKSNTPFQNKTMSIVLHSKNSNNILSKISTPLIKHLEKTQTKNVNAEKNVSLNKPTETTISTPQLPKPPRMVPTPETLSNIYKENSHEQSKENVNSTYTSVGTAVDDFNFFCKYIPNATSTPMNKIIEKTNLETCSFTKPSKTPERSYQSLIEANNNFLESLNKDNGNIQKQNVIEKSISHTQKSNLETEKPDVLAVNVKSQKEIEENPPDIDFRKYIKTPKLILSNSNLTQISQKMQSQILSASKNNVNANADTNVNVSVDKKDSVDQNGNVGKYASFDKYMNSKYANISVDKNVNVSQNLNDSKYEKVNVDKNFNIGQNVKVGRSGSVCVNKNMNVGQNINSCKNLNVSVYKNMNVDDNVNVSVNEEQNSSFYISIIDLMSPTLQNEPNQKNDRQNLPSADIPNKDLTLDKLDEKIENLKQDFEEGSKTNIETEIYNLERAIEDSQSSNDTKISRKRQSSPIRKSQEMAQSNLCAELIDSTSENKKTLKEKEKLDVDEPKADLNVSTCSLFSNINEQSFISDLVKRPEKVSTPKKQKTENIIKILPHDVSINNINLLSQPKPTTTAPHEISSKLFDDFKSPNVTLQKNFLRKPLLCISTPQSSDVSFKSAVSNISHNVTNESPILSNRISSIRSKRKAESESFYSEIKKYCESNISLPSTSSCVIPTVKQIKHTERLYVCKRDLNNKIIMKKVDENQRKMKIRNAKALLQKCFEKNIKDTMIYQPDESKHTEK